MTEEKRDAEHAEYAKASPRWEFITDALAGEADIKEKGETYLPKTPGMLSQDANATIIANSKDSDGAGLALKDAARSRYENYKLRAEFPEKVGPACDAAVGFFTDKDAAVEFPDGWKDVLDNATPEADTVWDLHRIVSMHVVQKGRCGVWADMRDKAKQPYWVPYAAEEVIDWHESPIGNEKVLDRLVIKTADEINGEASWLLTIAELREGGVFVDRYVKSRNGKDDWTPYETKQPRTARSDMGAGITDEVGKVNGFRLKRIPFQFINAESLKPAVGRIPFLPLAAQCLKVYRMDANYQEALSFYEPTPFISGMTQEWIDGGYAPKFYGAGVIWHGPSGSDAKMIEYSGPSIENQRLAIQDALQRADELSMKPFEPKTVAVESGDAKRQRTKTQTSAAKVMAQHVGAGLQKIMRFSGEWLGVDPSKIVFEPSYDFIEAVMDGQTLTQFVAAQQLGAMSKTTLHENLQRGGVTEKSFEEEQELIGKGE